MATYVGLIKFTEQGLRRIQDSPRRADAFGKLVASQGGRLREVFWTVGRYDGVLIFEAPGDEAAAALLLSVGKLGNVKTETLRAFTKREFLSILKRVK